MQCTDGRAKEGKPDRQQVSATEEQAVVEQLGAATGKSPWRDLSCKKRQRCPFHQHVSIATLHDEWHGCMLAKEGKVTDFLMHVINDNQCSSGDTELVVLSITYRETEGYVGVEEQLDPDALEEMLQQELMGTGPTSTADIDSNLDSKDLDAAMRAMELSTGMGPRSDYKHPAHGKPAVHARRSATMNMECMLIRGQGHKE
eukprot:1157257-Pelagomonas_calceolata.AAC.4